MRNPLTVAIGGGSGFLGSALAAALRSRGDRVRTLVRRPPRDPAEITWLPNSGRLDPARLAGVDVVVNLAGAGVGDRRWGPEHKAAILQSRVDSTHTVVGALLAMDRPARLVNASAVGFYGNRGEEQLTEASAPGTGFLPEVVQAWEEATVAAVQAGIPVSLARTGLVMGSSGGAFPQLARLSRLGIFGPLGSGRQWWPVISLRDEIAAYLHLIDHPEITGPVNLVGAEPVPQHEFAAALGAALHRPALVPAPAPALGLVVGEFSGEILASQRVLPERLLATGFTHQDPDVAAVVAAALGRG